MVERIKGVDEIAVDMDLTLHEYHCKDVLIWVGLRILTNKLTNLQTAQAPESCKQQPSIA